MTKAELVTKISENLGLEKNEVLATVENLMSEIKNSLNNGENVYLRGFGSFIIKKRAEKTGRNISKNSWEEEEEEQYKSLINKLDLAKRIDKLEDEKQKNVVTFL